MNEHIVIATSDRPLPRPGRRHEYVEGLNLWRTFCAECGRCLNVVGHRASCSELS